MNSTAILKSCTLLCAAAALAACGGGGGGGSASLQSAGPAASTVTYGPITGFGSVFVNGIHFDVNGAAVTDDGSAATVDDLKVGQMVRIEAERHGDGTTMPHATKIARDSALEGAISAIDSSNGTLTVLGQTVVIDADTLFGSDISPPSLLGLAVGDAIEVDAMLAADGSLHASRIEPLPSLTKLEVTGKIANLDATAAKFEINQLTVAYGQAVLEGFPASGPADGDLVEVKGDSLDASGALVATRVERKSFDDQRDHEADGVEIEGLITRFASATDFDVNEHPVTTTAATRVDGGALTDLALGLKVEAEGQVDASGVLLADKIELRHASDIRIEADIDAIDATAGTLELLGVTVLVDTHTRFDDRGPGDDRFLSLARLSVGDRVEIRGTAKAGSDEVLATRLERRDDGRTDVDLQGRVETTAEPSFTVLGTTIATVPATELVGLTAAELFGAQGQLVDVRGSWDGTTLTASRVALETEAEAVGDDSGGDAQLGPH